jgi:hypothetical protein
VSATKQSEVNDLKNPGCHAKKARNDSGVLWSLRGVSTTKQSEVNDLETQIAAQKKLATTVVFSGPCEER